MNITSDHAPGWHKDFLCMLRFSNKLLLTRTVHRNSFTNKHSATRLLFPVLKTVIPGKSIFMWLQSKKKQLHCQILITATISLNHLNQIKYSQAISFLLRHHYVLLILNHSLYIKFVSVTVDTNIRPDDHYFIYDQSSLLNVRQPAILRLSIHRQEFKLRVS